LASFSSLTSSGDVNEKNKSSMDVVLHQGTSNWLELYEDVFSE
jgi:hypothetical protein